MNKGKVLIIGGAGMIGSHTADLLFEKGYKIRILDNLSPRAHNDGWPEWVKPEYEKIKGDARDREVVEKALEGVDFVYHFAAMMDLMPQYSEFFDNNVTSTALLYEIIVENKLPIKKVIVASSQFVYGEGRAKCEADGEIKCPIRTVEQMNNQQWNPVCPICGRAVRSLPLVETHQDPPNQYAISKYTQELIALKLGRLNNIPSVAMRYSIVHGPRQSLKNAYSGALRLFTLQLLADKKLSIYEDGLQTRDYVSVYDTARANVLVLENDKANYENFNVGGGRGITVIELAKIISKTLKKDINIELSGEYRVGDIRDAVSDITKLEALGWKPEITEEKAVEEYVKWVKEQNPGAEIMEKAQEEMKRMGVVRTSY